VRLDVDCIHEGQKNNNPLYARIAAAGGCGGPDQRPGKIRVPVGGFSRCGAFRLFLAIIFSLKTPPRGPLRCGYNTSLHTAPGSSRGVAVL